MIFRTIGLFTARLKIFILNSFSAVKIQKYKVNNLRVEQYYDRETDLYLKTYGNIIQAARPTSDIEFINYLIEWMGVKDGMRLLDAGCGVCGIAIEIAKKQNVNIDAITLSKIQVEVAKKKINRLGLEKKVNVIRGDYAELNNIYPKNYFDIIYFQESLGYTSDISGVLGNAYSVLKQGGSIYIKDFFTVPILDNDNKIKQEVAVKLIRNQYLYKVHELDQLIKIFRDLGFYVEYVKPIKIVEDFSKASDFEIDNITHNIYTKVINLPFQLFESLELKFKKIHP